MNAIELLLERQSDARLIEPGPNAQQLEIIQKAALKVPDHGGLRPWHFIVVAGESKNTLGDWFFEAATKEAFGERTIERAKSLPHRSPMLIIAIAKTVPNHSKVPWLEQVESAACATFAMQQAAFAQNLGAVWRTGEFATSKVIKEKLALADHDEIVGFLYIGTPEVQIKKQSRLEPEDFFTFL
ncbi:Protein ydjA [Pseudoalteromonas luteoviolacea B = ATCC 29581]|nr:Protein ydjA [Pseudoalteromonas luteoviolacea B = ATCC 29581]